ncbi:glycosyltransferase family 4 protein [Mesoflavibacter zeaxanthinifaciens]|uniref:glycosyltransferase family 4 protein n=1 Tax=Mesoflavibacter zeaxanthinifaciens TaxID=393060 RepID=UPI003A91C36D
MDKIIIVYGSLNSIPSPEGAAPAKVIVDTVKHLDKDKFQVLSHFNKNLDPATYDTSLYKHINPSISDKLYLIWFKLKYNYAKRRELFITAQDSQLLYFIAVSRYIKRKGHKKIIVHVSTGLVAMIKHFNRDCEVVFYHHGTSLHTKLTESQWQVLLKNTIAIFGVNQAAATMANVHFKTKLPLNHYYKIANGVDQAVAPIKSEPTAPGFKILFSGRICKEKGVLELIKAFKILKDKQLDVELIIAGHVGTKRGLETGAAYLERCKEYISQNHLTIEFTGFLEQPSLYQLYEQVNVLVLPTDPKVYLEGMSLSLLEAMSMGKPLIGTNAGGTPEVIEDGVNGFLVYNEENYAAEIAEKIESIYLNKDLEKHLAENALKRYKEEFTTKKMGMHFLEALKEIGYVGK